MSKVLNNIEVLNNIRIVLIQTSHPGNIGSAARAMKTMGLSQLYLVKPKQFPDKQAEVMSANATDILDYAVVVDTFYEALKGCRLVIGSSARHERTIDWDVLDPRNSAERLVKQAYSGRVAIVFGRESSGLTNDELSLCHHLVHIPTNPDYSSLNVASAVQILSYECRAAALQKYFESNDALEAEISGKDRLVTVDEMEGYYNHLEEAMIVAGFLDPAKPKHLMTRLRRLYGRAKMTQSELNIMRGIVSAFDRAQRK